MVRGRRAIGGLAAALLCLLAFAATAQAAAKPRIHVLSNRADMISGGDALVAISLPRGAKPSRLRVRAGRGDVTRRFAVRQNGHVEGLVTGLRVGRTVLRATLRG